MLKFIHFHKIPITSKDFSKQNFSYSILNKSCEYNFWQLSCHFNKSNIFDDFRQVLLNFYGSWSNFPDFGMTFGILWEILWFFNKFSKILQQFELFLRCSDLIMILMKYPQKFFLSIFLLLMEYWTKKVIFKILKL